METQEELREYILTPLNLKPEENLKKYILKDDKLHLDATRLSDFANCERYFFFRHILQNTSENPDLWF